MAVTGQEMDVHTEKSTTVIQLEDALLVIIVLSQPQRGERHDVMSRTVYPHGIFSNGVTIQSSFQPIHIPSIHPSIPAQPISSHLISSHSIPPHPNKGVEMQKSGNKREGARKERTVQNINNKTIARFGALDGHGPGEVMDLGQVDVADVVAVCFFVV